MQKVENISGKEYVRLSATDSGLSRFMNGHGLQSRGAAHLHMLSDLRRLRTDATVALGKPQEQDLFEEEVESHAARKT